MIIVSALSQRKRVKRERELDNSTLDYKSINNFTILLHTCPGALLAEEGLVLEGWFCRMPGILTSCIREFLLGFNPPPDIICPPKITKIKRCTLHLRVK